MALLVINPIKYIWQTLCSHMGGILSDYFVTLVIGVLFYNLGYWLVIAPEHFILEHVITSITGEVLVKTLFSLLFYSLALIAVIMPVNKFLNTYVYVFRKIDKNEEGIDCLNITPWIKLFYLFLIWGALFFIIVLYISRITLQDYLDLILMGSMINRTLAIISIPILLSLMPIIGYAIYPIMFTPKNLSFTNRVKFLLVVYMFVFGALVGYCKMNWGYQFVNFGGSPVYYNIPKIGAATSLGILGNSVYIKGVNSGYIYQCKNDIFIKECAKRTKYYFNNKDSRTIISQSDNEIFDHETITIKLAKQIILQTKHDLLLKKINEQNNSLLIKNNYYEIYNDIYKRLVLSITESKRNKSLIDMRMFRSLENYKRSFHKYSHFLPQSIINSNYNPIQLNKAYTVDEENVSHLHKFVDLNHFVDLYINGIVSNSSIINDVVSIDKSTAEILTELVEKLPPLYMLNTS